MEKGFFKSRRFLLLGKDDGGTGLQRDRLNFAPQRPKKLHCPRVLFSRPRAEVLRPQPKYWTHTVFLSSKTQ